MTNDTATSIGQIAICERKLQPISSLVLFSCFGILMSINWCMPKLEKLFKIKHRATIGTNRP